MKGAENPAKKLDATLNQTVKKTMYNGSPPPKPVEIVKNIVKPKSKY